MPSKRYKPWQILSHCKDLENGLHSLIVENAYLESIVSQELKNQANEYKVYFSDEVDLKWFEEKFLTLGLFASTEDIFIYKTTKFNAELKKAFMDFDWSSIAYRVYLIDEKKNDFITKLGKECELNSITLDGPTPWEFNELLSFLCRYYQVDLGPRAFDYFIQVVDQDIDQYCQQLMYLKTLSNEFDLNNLKGHLAHSKFDFFELAKMYSHKQKNQVLKKLIGLDVDMVSWRRFFQFMQGHLSKIMDPSYADGKKKLSRYDQEIMRYSHNWERSDLLKEIEFFSEMEFMTKSNPDYLIQGLRNSYMKALSTPIDSVR